MSKKTIKAWAAIQELADYLRWLEDDMKRWTPGNVAHRTGGTRGALQAWVSRLDTLSPKPAKGKR